MSFRPSEARGGIFVLRWCQDPSATLGMTRRGIENGEFLSFRPSEARGGIFVLRWCQDPSATLGMTRRGIENGEWRMENCSVGITDEFKSSQKRYHHFALCIMHFAFKKCQDPSATLGMTGLAEDRKRAHRRCDTLFYSNISDITPARSLPFQQRRHDGDRYGLHGCNRRYGQRTWEQFP